MSGGTCGVKSLAGADQQVQITKNKVRAIGLYPTVVVRLPSGPLRTGKWYVQHAK